jgi:murein DD-endopeptidase MepM/ murein hydrolase activator NlpD
MRLRFLIFVSCLIWLAFWFYTFGEHLTFKPVQILETKIPWSEFFLKYVVPTLPPNEGFDFPVRPPEGNGVFISTKFSEDHHLGEDWNTAAGDNDLGEPVYSCGDGWVLLAADFALVNGKVIIIDYRLPDGKELPVIEMMYSNLGSLEVVPLQHVKKGQKIGTIGNNGGTNKAHLHWEVRKILGLGLGPTYSEKSEGWISPREFILRHQATNSKACLAKELPIDQQEHWGTD